MVPIVGFPSTVTVKVIGADAENSPLAVWTPVMMAVPDADAIKEPLETETTDSFPDVKTHSPKESEVGVAIFRGASPTTKVIEGRDPTTGDLEPIFIVKVFDTGA